MSLNYFSLRNRSKHSLWTTVLICQGHLPHVQLKARLKSQDKLCDKVTRFSRGPMHSPFRLQEGRAGRRMAAGECMKMSSCCHRVLLWIPAWSPHALSFSFQGRKTDTKWPLHLAFWSEMRILALCWGAWLYLGLVVKPLKLSWCVQGRMQSATQSAFLVFLQKFQLETRFGMKANGCDSRRTETPVKAKWIPPLTNCKVLPTFNPSITCKCPWMLSFFHPVNEKGHVWLFLI